MADAILVLNAGSSSLKFSVFLDSQPPEALLRGHLEGLFTQPRFVARGQAGGQSETKEWAAGTRLGHDGAIEFLFTWGRGGVLQGHRIIGKRLAGGRPVLGICVGMQILFSRGVEHGEETDGTGEWPGTVDRLHADVLPHMGWNTVRAPADSQLFAGLDPDERFYFVHSYAARKWELDGLAGQEPKVTWANHGEYFVAAVENGPLWATQFHPEKSGDAGAHLLRNWLATL